MENRLLDRAGILVEDTLHDMTVALQGYYHELTGSGNVRR